MNFLPEIPLTQFQAEAIARGLFAIAHADGVHEREEALVASFWAEAGGSDRALSELSRRQAITTEELSTALSTPELRRVFLKTALLLAFADGQVSRKESELVRHYSKELGLDAELSTLEEQVKEYLLGQLAHIHNTQALVEIAKKLAI
jgi:tellurite resistance protein